MNSKDGGSVKPLDAGVKVVGVMYDCVKLFFPPISVKQRRYISSTLSPIFPIYFMAVAETAEAINAGGSLRELPEGTLLHTASKL